MENVIDLAYTDVGEGVPLVLVHGYPLDRSIWSEVAQRLSGIARVICPDLRGFGESPVTEGVYTMRLLAADLIHLLDRLGVRDAVFAGHSMGGYVSLALAKAYPQRVSGLALVTSHAAADPAERKQGRLEQAEEVERDGVAGIVERGLESYSPDKRARAFVREIMLRTNPLAVAGALRGMAEREDLTDLLPEIDVPSLVVGGEADELIAARKSADTAALLPHGKLVMIPGGGHLPMLEVPERVAEALRELVLDVGGRKRYGQGGPVS